MPNCLFCKRLIDDVVTSYYIDLDSGQKVGNIITKIVKICMIKKLTESRNFEIKTFERKKCRWFLDKRSKTLDELFRYAKNTQL